MIVLDASATVDLLLTGEHQESLTEAILRADGVAAPDHMAVEVLSVLRGLVRAQKVTVTRAEQVLDDLQDMPIMWFETRNHVRTAWRLRDNASAYDAVYVALAHELDSVVVSLDRRLQRAFPGTVKAPADI